jgi:starch phosphorylase
MQIVHQINRYHLDAIRAAGRPDTPPLAGLSLIDDSGSRRLRMSSLAFVGSHKVNGVSALHTNLMRQTVFRDLHWLYPDRIVNKTNGITFRRWLFSTNPALTDLLVDVIGPRIWDEPEALADFANAADDAGVLERLAETRRTNKMALANLTAHRLGIELDPDALFDVHIKRFHEYKRQLMNILQTIALYYAIRDEPSRDWIPRVQIFAGKAAPSYHRAKLIIKLVHDVAQVVNNDPAIRGRLKVVFLPNYNVSLAEAIIPAADVSEQISTAGLEASGTGNMKLALNGALTIGTVDGANIEIRERVGDENLFIFGLTAAQVEQRRQYGPGPREAITACPALREVLDTVGRGMFSPDEPQRYRQLVDDLTNHDHFLVTADFAAYAAAQRDIAARWVNRRAWWHASAINIARVGWFSSDRAIREYASDIWNVTPDSP